MANLGLHLMKMPSGRWGFVGSVPGKMHNKVPATSSDIAAGRAFKEAGEYWTWKLPNFATSDAAIEYADQCGVRTLDVHGNPDKVTERSEIEKEIDALRKKQDKLYEKLFAAHGPGGTGISRARLTTLNADITKLNGLIVELRKVLKDMENRDDQ